MSIDSLFATVNRGSAPPNQNIAVKVTGYALSDRPDESVVIGTDIATGRDVRVSLRPDTRKNKKFPRPEVADFAFDITKLPPQALAIQENLQKAQRAVYPGGVILFDDASPARNKGEGNFTAWWPTKLAASADDLVMVRIAMARALPVVQDQRSGQIRQQVESLFPDAAVMVSRADHLAERIAQSLDIASKVPGTRGFMLRATDPGTGEVKAGFVYESIKLDPHTNAPIVKSSRDVAQDILATAVGSAINGWITNGQPVEIVPVVRANVGADTVKTNTKGSTPEEIRPSFERFYKTSSGEVGFAPSVVAMKPRKGDKGWFVSHIGPTSTAPALYGPEMVPTGVKEAEPAAALAAAVTSAEPEINPDDIPDPQPDELDDDLAHAARP